MMQLVHMVATPGADITLTASRSRDASWTSSGDWLLKHVITPSKLGVGIAHWMTFNSCVGEGVYGGAVVISQLWNLCPRLPDRWEICSTATTGQDGCNTFSQLGNLEDFLSTAGFPAAFVVACTSGAMAGMVPVLWAQPSYLDQWMSPPEGSHLQTPPHLRRRGSTSSPPTAPLHSWATGMAYFQ